MEQVTFASGRPRDTPPDLRLIHYNDVYHLDPSSAEPVGGFSRFMSVIREYRDGPTFADQGELLSFFSGDCFNPSLESSVTKGEHMVPVLNKLNISCACVGNHDLDFGVDQFHHLSSRCKFPWLLANVLDPALGPDTPLGNVQRTHLITTSTGIRIGLIGLAEREWLTTVNCLPPNLVYLSATATARDLVPKLRAEGADIIIALTHMREPNDNKLATNTAGLIDIILGGHDHYYAHSFLGGTHVLRSGSDFKQLSYIEARRRPQNLGALDKDGARELWDFDILRRDIDSSVPEDPGARELVSKLTAQLKRSVARPIGWTAAPLDARFVTVRARESNIGNFVCDVMRAHFNADCAIMASGTIRGDQIYPPGALRIRDITLCFPFEDPAMLMKVKGRNIVAALENGVSQYPALEGRFPQVSNIVFEFDPKRPAGDRITSVSIGGEALVDEKLYTLATRGYMSRGKDGYDALLSQSEGGPNEEIIPEESGILISTLLRQYFMGLQTIHRWRNLAPHFLHLAHACYSPPSTTAVSASTQSSAPSSPLSASQSWSAFHARRTGANSPPHNDNSSPSTSATTPATSDNEDNGIASGADNIYDEEDLEHERISTELLLMRKFFSRWVRKAGLESSACDAVENASVDWTRVIAPTVEGRIRMIA